MTWRRYPTRATFKLDVPDERALKLIRFEDRCKVCMARAGFRLHFATRSLRDRFAARLKRAQP